MGETTNDHQLWVSLSALGDGNVFAVLPDLMKSMLTEDVIGDMDNEIFDVVLPSDEIWRTKIYYKLVEKQRMADNSEETMLDHIPEETVKLHDWNIIHKKNNSFCEPIVTYKGNRKRKYGLNPITWTVSDLAKAGSLLSRPPISTSFDDEQEMRRVYTLIYDVFRYKNILMQALNDVAFFAIYPMLSERKSHVWLLLYDLYHRSFKKRENKVMDSCRKLFDSIGLMLVENALWIQRVKIAASISRLRIERNALSLNDLLPHHLKDERITVEAKEKPVTCWVNTKKVQDPNKLSKELEDELEVKQMNHGLKFSNKFFVWDKHCPQIIAFHSTMRTKLARSSFVKSHKLIVQDKSFCLGPATFGKIVEDLELCGSVIQSHVNSPRSTAYLAALLSQNEKIKKLMAFSAGKRKPEYELYFNELGMNNISIFSDRLIDCPPDAMYMEEVVAVFATPPNSYSAVDDPIDLVCSRGGDLSMLEVLTESADSNEAKDRVSRILEEQRRTLRFAMSRPQIQLVLYETHSELEAENKGMVNKALTDINKIAKIQHATLQGKLVLPPNQPGDDPVNEINNNEKPPESSEEDLSLKPSIILRTRLTDNEFLDNIEVPDTDIFDVPQLPSLCPNEVQCGTKDGCYLALLQRKQLIRLDDKYMIQMAEHRGLFGSNASKTTVKSKSSRSIKKVEKIEKPIKKARKKLQDKEIERIAAPTYTFLKHSFIAPCETECQKCQSNEEGYKEVNQYRRWWTEAAHHIINLKSSLVRQKILPPISRQIKSRNVINTMIHNTARVDEIVAKTNSCRRIPVFPKLKLTRNVITNRVEVPLAITPVEFPRADVTRYPPIHR